MFRRIFHLLLLVAFLSPLTNTISSDDYLTLTLPQKESLDEFAERIRPWITQSYMLKEAYLIRWLREVYFDVDEAEKMFRNNLVWREENDIDNILEGDFSEMDSFFTTEVVGCDKEGMPVLVVVVRDWDLRSIILRFGVERLAHYADRVVEEACAMERRMEEEGGNVTQLSVVMDIGGFNLIQHGCPNCVTLILRLVSRLQYHYPGYVHKFVAVNTPHIALPFWGIGKQSILTPSTIDAVEIHGFNKKEWQRALRKWVDPSQLSTYFGGRRDRGLDIQEYRLSGETFSCTSQRWREVDDIDSNNI